MSCTMGGKATCSLLSRNREIKQSGNLLVFLVVLEAQSHLVSLGDPISMQTHTIHNWRLTQHIALSWFTLKLNTGQDIDISEHEQSHRLRT